VPGDSREEVGPYIVYEQLGSGGMATVHRAEQRGIAGFRRVVALKRLHANVAADPDLLKAFIHEARLASYLKHANVAQTFDLGKVGETYFIAMEFVPGPTLGQLMRQCAAAAGPIPLGIVLSIMIQICDALDHAHNLSDESGKPLGIIHRDVSPSNVIVSNTGTVKLIDFGIAKAANSDVRTQTGMIKGKFGYIAPEYLAGQLDRRGDLFGAGVIAHELIAGRPLFLGRNDFDTLSRVREMPISPPSRWNPSVPPDLDDIVLTALARDPEQRWQSAAAMRNAMHHALRSVGVVTGQQLYDWVEWAFMQVPRSDAATPRQELDDPSYLIEVQGRRSSVATPLTPSVPPPGPSPLTPGLPPSAVTPDALPIRRFRAGASVPPTAPGSGPAARRVTTATPERETVVLGPAAAAAAADRLSETLPGSAFPPETLSPSELDVPAHPRLRRRSSHHMMTPTPEGQEAPARSRTHARQSSPPAAAAPDELPPETLPPSAFAPETLPASAFADTPPAALYSPGPPAGPPVDPAVKLAAAMLAPTLAAPVLAPKLVAASQSPAARPKAPTTPPPAPGGRAKAASIPPPLPGVPTRPSSMPGTPPPLPPPPSPGGRTKAASIPPPLPGVATRPPPPPPSPGGRAKAASIPPPLPPSGARALPAGSRPPPLPLPRSSDGDGGITEPSLPRYNGFDPDAPGEATDPVAPRAPGGELDPTERDFDGTSAPAGARGAPVPPPRPSRKLESPSGPPPASWPAPPAGTAPAPDAAARPSRASLPSLPIPGRASLPSLPSPGPGAPGGLGGPGASGALLVGDGLADDPLSSRTTKKVAKKAAEPEPARDAADAKAAAKEPPGSEEESPHGGSRSWLVLLLLLLAAIAAGAAAYYFGFMLDP
jgi:serine/threonine protein kinase